MACKRLRGNMRIIHKQNREKLELDSKKFSTFAFLCFKGLKNTLLALLRPFFIFLFSTFSKEHFSGTGDFGLKFTWNQNHNTLTYIFFVKSISSWFYFFCDLISRIFSSKGKFVNKENIFSVLFNVLSVRWHENFCYVMG